MTRVEGHLTAFSCPDCPEGTVIQNMPQWMLDKGCVPQCDCGTWMEKLDDDSW